MILTLSHWDVVSFTLYISLDFRVIHLSQLHLPTRFTAIAIAVPKILNQIIILHTGSYFSLRFRRPFLLRKMKKVKSTKQKVRWAFETTYYVRALKESTFHRQQQSKKKKKKKTHTQRKRQKRKNPATK